MDLDAEKQRASQLRKQLRRVERHAAKKRRELHALETSIFAHCAHEWEKKWPVEDVACGLWYAYCPDTCKHCGMLKSGPVKL